MLFTVADFDPKDNVIQLYAAQFFSSSLKVWDIFLIFIILLDFINLFFILFFILFFVSCMIFRRETSLRLSGKLKFSLSPALMTLKLMIWTGKKERKEKKERERKKKRGRN